MLDGKQVGTLDRRKQKYSVLIPERKAPARLDILVEAMGHVNFGTGVDDPKGVVGGIKLVGTDQVDALQAKWEVFPLPLDAGMMKGLQWKDAGAASADSAAIHQPGFWRGTFQLTKVGDTFVDLRKWGKGVVWVNGHGLGRYWNIGPTQTAYLPGAWLKQGANEIVILDLLGPAEPSVAGLEKPILNELHPELDVLGADGQAARVSAVLKGVKPVLSGTFASATDVQDVKLAAPITGKQFCLESVNAFDGKQFASIAELDLLDPAGNSIPHQNWSIAYVDSEEKTGEDGSATNAIDGQTASFWHSAWKAEQPTHPHQIVIDLGSSVAIGGFRYTPRPGANAAGHIKEYRVYIGEKLVGSGAQQKTAGK
jgi:beta-galactosidase